MSLQVIPLTNDPNLSFTVQLQVDGAPLTLIVTIGYNSMAQYWVMSISNTNGTLLIDSIPLVTGVYPAGNLLQQQRYLGIGSWYIVNVSNLSQDTANDVGYGDGGYGWGGYGGLTGQAGLDYPNETNLGTDFQLWVNDTPSV